MVRVNNVKIMDNIDKIKSENKIVTASLNAAAYVMQYNSDCKVKIILSGSYRMFEMENNFLNKKAYKEYKNDKNDLFVELRAYNKIIRYLKKLSRDFVSARS